MSLTFIGQKAHQMSLMVAKNSDKCLEIGDTSASQNSEKFDVPVIMLCNLDNVISL